MAKRQKLRPPGLPRDFPTIARILVGIFSDPTFSKKSDLEISFHVDVPLNLVTVARAIVEEFPREQARKREESQSSTSFV